MGLYRMRVISETFVADKKWISEYSENVYATTLAVYSENKAAFLSELQIYPPPRKGKMRWKNDRQRIAVMAKLRREGNLPYVRSGLLASKWEFTIERSSDDVLMSLVNNAPYSRFVMGDFTSKPSIIQQPFHKDTGWAIADTLRKKWYGTMKTEIAARVSTNIANTRLRFRKQRKDAKR